MDLLPTVEMTQENNLPYAPYHFIESIGTKLNRQLETVNYSHASALHTDISIYTRQDSTKLQFNVWQPQ